MILFYIVMKFYDTSLFIIKLYAFIIVRNVSDILAFPGILAEHNFILL